jgi:hypothetical protein
VHRRAETSLNQSINRNRRSLQRRGVPRHGVVPVSRSNGESILRHESRVYGSNVINNISVIVCSVKLAEISVISAAGSADGVCGDFDRLSGGQLAAHWVPIETARPIRRAFDFLLGVRRRECEK